MSAHLGVVASEDRDGEVFLEQLAGDDATDVAAADDREACERSHGVGRVSGS